jgi:hypothetical protein
MKKTLLHYSIVCGLIFNLSVVALAQDDPPTRSITSDDFSKQRPAGKSKSVRGNKKTNRATYKFVRRNNPVVRKKNAARKPITQTKKAKVSEIGVTMWKLRPSRPSDKGYKLPVLFNNLRQMWTAERVNLETAFQAGDRIRLAIESSVSGYLYVVNSELYADGNFGEPFLIFPASLDEDNSVQPGLLIDIPDQTEDFPYFLINPKKANYVGELLTVIISPKPVSNLKTDQDGKITNIEELADLEINSEAEIFSRFDSADKIYTQAEAEATCGAKNRQLEREKRAAKPCGEKTRQLTREEPLPQTIYRVKTSDGQMTVALITLNVKQ